MSSILADYNALLYKPKCLVYVSWIPNFVKVYSWRTGFGNVLSSSEPHLNHTSNEGPVRIQYKCLVPIYVFPEMKLLFPKHYNNVLSPSSSTHISVRDLYISKMGLPILLQENTVCGPILGIYKSLTDTGMWKLGLKPSNFQKRNT